MHRRHFLMAALAGAAAAAFPMPRGFANSAQALSIGRRTIEVNGKAATVYSLLGPDGRPGLTLDAGADFDVVLANGLGEETLIHWHGLLPPWDQDGVPGLPAALLAPGETRPYRFPVGAGGTHWMHAHTLQEQNLLAAPLIVRTAEDRAADEQEVVVLFHDFSFTPADELLARLTDGTGHSGGMAHGMDMGGMHMGGGTDMGGMDHGSGQGMMGMDLNDIAYDAYLANDRTLDDPEVHRVEAGGFVRLRLINGASSTAFTIDLGSLAGELIAVDGCAIIPVAMRQVPLSMGQRADIRLRIPKEGGVFPVLALREGARERTGVILASAGAAVSHVATSGEAEGPVLDLPFEASLRAAEPLAARPVAQSAMVHLTGDMTDYRWQMAGMDGFRVRRGERVEIGMMNMSMMAHPMHLHGHHFQVVAIDGRRVSGAVRDTVLVPPMRTVTVAVDADNPSRWAFHCHHLYHMASGMMGEFAYEGIA